MKIKTRGAQAFNVPNDEEGERFLALLRRYRNRGWHYLARNRGPRKALGDKYVSFSRQLSIPRKDAEWMAVYLKREPGPKLHEGPAVEANPCLLGESTGVEPTYTSAYSRSWFGAAPDGPGPHDTEPFEAPDKVDTSHFRAHMPPSAPAAVVSLPVVVWSSQIQTGQPVGLTPTGKAYNYGVHGSLGDPGKPAIGPAVRGTEGPIGEGEATVHVNLNLDHPIPKSLLDAVMVEPGGLPEPEEDEDEGHDVELTLKEQELLEWILRRLSKLRHPRVALHGAENWSLEDAKTFDRLFYKLVD